MLREWPRDRMLCVEEPRKVFNGENDPSERPYRLSFSFGGLLVPETETVVKLFAQTNDWNTARERAVDRGELQKTRKNAAYRYFREIRRRLDAGYEWERDHLVAGDDDDRRLILLAIVARHYRLIGEFLVEVVRDRLYHGPETVESYVFRGFLEQKAMIHPEVARLADTTIDKLRTVTMRILREAGVAHGKREPYTIIRPRLSEALDAAYRRDGSRDDLLHLLYADKEIDRCR